MSLVTTMAFQASPFTQWRAFTILGSFSGYDDDVFYQMLIAFKKNLLISYEDEEASASLSMLRCMRKAVPGLARRSRYLGSVFWLAVSLIQAAYAPLYTEAMRLVQVTIETMDQHEMFCSPSSSGQNPMATVLMAARAPLWAATAQLDELSALSFETDFGFALASAIWRGVRFKADFSIVRAVLSTLMKASVKSINPHGEPQKYLDGTTLPLFMGLAPCVSTREYGRILEDDCRVVDPFPDCEEYDDEDFEFTCSFDMLGVSDMTAALLANSFLLAIEDLPILDTQDRENLYCLTAEFAKVYPELFASGVWHFMDSAPCVPFVSLTSWSSMC